MKARQHITTLLKQWLELTHREAHAIQMGRWSQLSRIQKAKGALQEPLNDAIAQWKNENPAEFACYPFRSEISRLLALEADNSELLALRKREVREKILLIEQALDDLRRLHSAYSQAAAA
jgi:outer membrane PBP1 activator LpoA protein